MKQKKQDKRNKFVRCAEQRVTNAVKQISLVGNLSNSRKYDYSTKDVNAIFKAINDAVRNAKAKYAQTVRKNISFQLNSQSQQLER